MVKATLLRMTLHAVVVAEDCPVFHTAMQRALRASRLGDRWFASTGVSAANARAAGVLGRLRADRHRRYARWWTALPRAEARVLPG